MKLADLTWYRLTFPRDLSSDAVLAALSALTGLRHGTRLVFDLSAAQGGIGHRLAVSPDASDITTAALRAAIPSLRLEPMEAPEHRYSRRLLWQLTPASSAIRVDELGSTAAGLLATAFPLGLGESVRLMWLMRPSARPQPQFTSEQSREGYVQAMRHKLALPGLAGHGELRVQAATHERAVQLLHGPTSILRSLSSPHGRLIHDGYVSGHLLRLLGQRGRYLSVAELAAVIGWPIDGPDLPGLELGASRRLVPSAVLPEAGRVLGVSNFAGVARPVAISAAASTRGLYVLGPTGTGKTSLIKNLVVDDLRAGLGLAVVETNGDLIEDLLDLIPPERVDDVVLLDPLDVTHAVGFNPFASQADPSLVADQLGELFQRLWKAYWGPRTGQLAHMGLLTLARRRGSTLLDLPRLLQDAGFRRQVLTDLDDPVGLEPDWRWFQSLQARDQATVIAPLLNKVRQFTAREGIRAIIGQAAPALSVQRLLAERKVLLVHLPKGLLGAETAQLLGCLVLTALWQAIAQRVELAPAERHPFGLYVDEVQDFAEAPVPWEEMFAQGRKYGLSLSVAHQNLLQLPREIREVVLANARSKAVFALSSSDAKALEPLFAPALTAADLGDLDAYSTAAIVALDDGSSGRPVTLSTPPPPTPVGSSATVRRASRANYARPRSEVEATLRQAAGNRTQTAPVGRRRRPS